MHNPSQPAGPNGQSDSSNLRVYISSTFSDLHDYRKAVTLAITRLGFRYVGMEKLPASSESPLSVAFELLEASDIVILLVAWRLGYVPPEGFKSLVELEYEKALDLGRPVLIFLLDEGQPWPMSHTDLGAPELVKAFRARLSRDRVVSFFTTPDDLAAKVVVALSQYTSRAVVDTPPTPSPPTPESLVLDSVDVISELRAMRAELSVLQQSIAGVLRQQDAVKTFTAEGFENSPASFLGPAAPSIAPDRCFVIMPYSQNWSEAVQRIIFEVCGEVGLDFRIAKEMEGRFIPHDIWTGITEAGVIVADLSGANPNVTYEIGLADVIGKEVILIAQKTNVPFDFLAQRLIEYEDSLPGSLALREQLKDRLQRYKASQNIE